MIGDTVRRAGSTLRRTRRDNGSDAAQNDHDGAAVRGSRQTGRNDNGSRDPSVMPAYRGALKRATDVVGSGVGLILLAPLFCGIAVTIKATSRGPVFFRQHRYGQHGRLFAVYKFRTMYTDRQDLSGVTQTLKDDPRITRIGRFLRSTSFDELPQLWNVFKGEMSLVGPRPHVPNMLAAGKPYEEFSPYYMDRHKVRPGITGLAQVRGFRGETREAYAARMRLHYDLEYVSCYSNRMDARIVIRTIWQEFVFGSGY